MKKKQDIEDIFQEAFESYSVKPDASVWANIQSQIPTASISGGIGSALGKASMLSKIIVGTVLIGGITTSAYFFSTSQEETKPTENFQNPTATEQNNKNAEPISINIEADSLEHLSKEVKKEKIQEIEEILVQPKNELAKAEEKTQKSIAKESKLDKGIDVDLDEIIQKEIEASKKELVEDASIKQNKTSTSENQDKIQENKAVKEEVSTEIAENKSEDANTADTVETNTEVEKEIHRIIPNIFTPNQDGINDVFRIESEDATDLEVAIFDKRGQKLFEWKGLYGFWDGRLPNGEMAAADNYFYNVILTKGDYNTVEKGSVLLKK